MVTCQVFGFCLALLSGLALASSVEQCWDLKALATLLGYQEKTLWTYSKKCGAPAGRMYVVHGLGAHMGPIIYKATILGYMKVVIGKR